MWDLLISLFRNIVPPINSAEDIQYAWRVRIALVSCAAFVGVLTITAIAFGYAPGVSGFARVSDLDTVISEIKINRIDTIEAQILDLRIKHCKATTTEAKQLYWDKISHLMLRYERLTDKVFTLPACTDL